MRSQTQSQAYPMSESESDWDKYNRIARDQPDDFDNWERLIYAAEHLDKGNFVSKLSHSSIIKSVRSSYDKFLDKFPLLFGYWKKYADVEYSISGSEGADKVYLRGLAAIPYSVDLWHYYLSFKMEVCHDSETMRSIFEEGIDLVGLDFYAHTIWDKYIEFEERLEEYDRVLRIFERIIHLPMHQYARYFERYSQYVRARPLKEIASSETIAQIREAVLSSDPAKKTFVAAPESLASPEETNKSVVSQDTLKANNASSDDNSVLVTVKRSESEIEADIRNYLHKMHLEVFKGTQIATTKRWTYEGQIKRTYFTVSEVEVEQLHNWNKYLDFEEIESNTHDKARIIYLYEKALIPCALYDFMWMRYIRWLDAQSPTMSEHTRLVFSRASAIFVPIARPGIRIQYALWEEKQNQLDTARSVLETLAKEEVSEFDAIVALAYFERRHNKGTNRCEAAKAVLDSFGAKIEDDLPIKGKLVAEKIRIVWKSEKNIDLARKLFQEQSVIYINNQYMWINYFQFEHEQASITKDSRDLRQVVHKIMTDAQIPSYIVRALVHKYQIYLLEESDDKTSILQYFELDREIDGPYSVQQIHKAKLSVNNDATDTDRYLMLTNGHPGIELINGDMASHYDEMLQDQRQSLGLVK